MADSLEEKRARTEELKRAYQQDAIQKAREAFLAKKRAEYDAAIALARPPQKTYTPEEEKQIREEAAAARAAYMAQFSFAQPPEIKKEEEEEEEDPILALLKERERLVGDIKKARESGDLSENADYHAARENLSRVNARIALLENKPKQKYTRTEAGEWEPVSGRMSEKERQEQGWVKVGDSRAAEQITAGKIKKQKKLVPEEVSELSDLSKAKFTAHGQAISVTKRKVFMDATPFLYHYESASREKGEPVWQDQDIAKVLEGHKQVAFVDAMHRDSAKAKGLQAVKVPYGSFKPGSKAAEDHAYIIYRMGGTKAAKKVIEVLEHYPVGERGPSFVRDMGRVLGRPVQAEEYIKEFYPEGLAETAQSSMVKGIGLLSIGIVALWLLSRNSEQVIV